METSPRIRFKLNHYLLCLVAILFAVFPFWSGLFFDVPAVSSNVYISLVFLVVAIVALIRKTEIKGFSLADGLIIAYTLVVLLSVFNFANLEFTLTGIAGQFAYLFLYLLVRMMLATSSPVRWFLYLISGTGALFSLYGLLAAFNVIHDPNALMIDAAEKRIASVFQYANTYASYASVALVLALALLTELKSRWARALWIFASVLTLIGLILSYSRGGWVIFVLAVIVLFLLTSKQKRMVMGIHMISVLLIMAASLPLISKASTASSASKGFIGLAIALALTLIIAYFSDSLLSRAEGIKYRKSLLFPILGVLVLAVGLCVWKLKLVPQNVLHRISTINLQQFSVQQRFVFYKDGLSALKDHAVLGTGNRTWEATFFKYQSYPYYTTAPHSLLIDQLLNTGILGTLLFLTVLFVAVRGLWKLRRTAEDGRSLAMSALLVAFLELVVHALMDVDFNYGIMDYLFWLFVAVAAQCKSWQVQSESSKSEWNWKPANRWVWWSGGLVTIVLALFGASYNYANHQLDAAKTNLSQPAVALQHLDSANRFAPYITDVPGVTAELYAKYYQRSQDPVILTDLQNTLKNIPSLAPNNGDLLARTGQSLFVYDPIKGTALLGQAWQDAPYRSEIAEQYMIFTTEIGQAYLQQKDPSDAKHYFQETMNTYNTLWSRIEGLKQLPPVLHLERKYAATGKMYQFTALSAYYLGQYDQAEIIGQAGLRDPSTDRVELAALVAASQEKLHKKISPELSHLVGTDAKAKQFYNQFLKQS